ncbi:COG5395 Predicted membrane protein [Rhabdaerophilaceae bacterium]
MSISPFYAAPLLVKVHIVAAIVVAFLTAFQFWILRKGSAGHKASGYIWLGAMACVAMTSFWIPSHFRFSVYGFSFIHALSVLALLSVLAAVYFARKGRIAAHRLTLIWLTISFWVAGTLAFVPPRIIGRIVFG